MEKKLNSVVNISSEKFRPQDIKIIMLCSEKEYTVSELADKLGVRPKNISVRIDSLEKENIIKVNRQGRGKTTILSTNKNHEDFKEIKENWEIAQKMQNIFNNSSLEKQKEMMKIFDQTNNKPKS